MSTLQKIVPKSKRSEWRGLDRISSVVHGMGCIWREQEKDDVGLDGEIELCRARDDGGDGLVGTGKIVKVQSKSGTSYVIKDGDASFASPVAEKDLHYWAGCNVPVIYVVYHPGDDALYWKDVKTYLKVRPDALTPPFRIEFEKAADRFDDGAYAALCALCEVAPERVSMQTGETLYADLLEVLEPPERIWVTPVLPEKRARFHDRLTGVIPPYVFRSGNVVTLRDPTEPGTALTGVVDPSPEEFRLEDWLGRDRDAENDFRALLASVVHRHLRRLGLEFDRDSRRYFFNQCLAEDAPLHRKWTSARTGRTQMRLVAKHYSYGKVSFYRHHALQVRIERFGGGWAIALRPALHFTTDGRRTWEGEIARSYAIRARAEQYNDIYLNNVLFWANQLARGEPTFRLTVGDKPLGLVSGVPLTVEVAFSVQPAGPSRPERSGG